MIGNKPETRKGTGREPWVPPRGIRYKFNRARAANPFQLVWVDDGRERTQSFADEPSREGAARALAEKREDFGNEILSFDPREWRTWLAFKAKIAGADPMLVAREWLVHRQGRGLSTGDVVVESAVVRYLKFRAGENLSADTYRHFKKHLKDRFAAVYPSKAIADLTPELISEWLDGLKHPKTGEPMDPLTRRHHRKDLNTFLDYCVRQGWTMRNPCELVAVPKIAEGEVELLTLAEARALFAANAKQRLIGRLALEAFGGLRSSSAARIGLEDINAPEKGIRIPGSIHKGGKTIYRQGHPANLWAWIVATPGTCWKMSKKDYDREKHDAFARAGLGFSENRLRKTFASAHLAWLKNQPLTSYLMQHKHTSTTDIYLGVMSEGDAAAYFKILPTTI